MTREEPILYIFSGLPGSGKTSLALRAARHLRCAYLRIDTIEQGLRELLSANVEGEGYRLAYRIVSDNLRVGTSVVADSCNPLELTRREWEQVAREAGAYYLNIEVVCSETHEHRRRVDARAPDIPGMKLPSWDEVKHRAYEPWTVERIVIDTAGKSVGESIIELLSELSRLDAATLRSIGLCAQSRARPVTLNVPPDFASLAGELRVSTHKEIVHCQIIMKVLGIQTI